MIIPACYDGGIVFSVHRRRFDQEVANVIELCHKTSLALATSSNDFFLKFEKMYRQDRHRATDHGYSRRLL